MKLVSLRNVLILLAAGLAVAFGYQTDWGDEIGKPQVALKPVTARQDATGVLPDFRLGAESSAYSQIAERPLLNPTRKLAPTQIVMAATEPPKPQVRRGLYQLLGVSDLGSVKIAQVREVANNRIKSVRLGDNLQELTVASIDDTRVVLVFQGENDTLDLPKFTASARVPQPVAPAPLAAPPQPAAAAQPVVAAALPKSPPASTGTATVLEGRRAARAAAAATNPPATAATAAQPAAAPVMSSDPSNNRTSMRDRLGIGRRDNK